MAFASIYIPIFLVQSVARAEAALRDRAIALVAGTPPIEKVVAMSEAAARAGIQLSMTKSQATQFSGIEIRSRSRAQEKATHAALLDLGWSVSPRLEDTALDTIVLDLAGLASLFHSDKNIANELVWRAAVLGLLANVAISSNLEAAIHAARGFPGVTIIPPGKEAQRLGCMPIGVLSPSLEVLETLERWGVRTCAELAALPLLQLSERLGQEGVRLHELARGASRRSLVLAESSICFEEEMPLDYAVAELEPLAFLLGRLLDQLCARLMARSLAAGAIRLRFDLERSPENNPQFSDGKPSREPALGIYERVLTLPVPMRESKMLLRLLRLQLQANPPKASIIKIYLAAEPARQRFAQGGLFLPSSPDPEKLELTIARLTNLVGDSHIGSPELVDTHRPGEFRMNRFVPSRDESLKNRKSSKPATGFRVFRPSLPLKVELREGHPARISFRGMRGEVVAVSGPWRTSGDWWREDPWQHDEWDIEIHFRFSPAIHLERTSVPCPQRGLYRIYYDALRGNWFMRGIYD
ncbi:MAG: Y-family DNA polymerase [Candidatus Acidiferrales bacterium]